MASRSSSRPLTFQVTVAVLALAVCSFLAILGFGLYAMLHADRDALATQRAFAENGLKERVEATAQEQESVTVWDDAVSFAKAHDDVWMSENLSAWMHDYYGHDRVYVLNEFNDPVHAMVDGTVVWKEAFAEIAGAAKPLVDDLRLLMMQVAAGERTDEPKLGVTDIIALNGVPAIVGVMPIVPSSDRLTQNVGTEYLHVSVQFIDDVLIGRIAEQYHLANARLAPLSARANPASIPILDSGGSILGYIAWDRDRPGLTFISKTAPALIVSALLAVGLLAFLLRRLRRASAELERSQNESEFLAFHDTLTGLPIALCSRIASSARI
jgi:sensor domain CHASE-containing protein